MDRCCTFSDYGIPIAPRFSQQYQQQADNIFGGLIIKAEKKPEEKFNTEVLKALLDECEGSKSERINEVGKDEYLEIYDSDYDSDTDDDSSSESEICYRERKQRVLEVRRFTDDYKFAHGGKICIYPCGPPIFTSSDKCYESTWVGVHGMQSICMVIGRDMDMRRLHPFYQKDSMKQQNMHMFARAAISEVECLPHKDVDYYDDAFRRLCTGTVEKPFAVVSLGSGTLEESGYEDTKSPHGCVFQSINYLESHLSSELFHTHYGIIRVAIMAYQLLCLKELRAEDIWVTIMNVSGGLFDDLPMDMIGEQLAYVNGLSSEKDPQKPLFVFRGLQV